MTLDLKIRLMEVVTDVSKEHNVVISRLIV